MARRDLHLDLFFRTASPVELSTLVQHEQVDVAHALGEVLAQLLGAQAIAHEKFGLADQVLLMPVVHPVHVTIRDERWIVFEYQAEAVAVACERKAYVKVAAYAKVKKLFRIDEHARKLAFHTRSNRVIQPFHFIICVQIVTFAVVCQAIDGVKILVLYQVF